MSGSSALTENIQQHYTRADLGTTILKSLSDAGKDINQLKPEDLSAVDEFHIRGREATLELARALRLDEARDVLDVGSGIGGPSRCLAHEFGCRVTGIDLTEEYCRVATMLAERIGLSKLVSYIQGDALNLPFPNSTFDVVWTQHVAMNILAKAKLYGEIRRVLRPGGALAIYDILAGPGGPVHFPVPWARFPDTSFLVTPEDLRRLLEGSGFRILSFNDTTAAARAWFTNVAARIQQSGLPPLGFHLLLGSDFQAMAQNQRRNLEEERIVLAEVVAER